MNEEQLKKLLAEDPNHIPGYRALQAIYWKENRYEELAASLLAEQSVCESDLRCFELFREAGNVFLLRLDDKEKAIEAYQNAIAASPNNPDGYRALIDAQIKAGKTADAVESIKQLADRVESPAEKADLALRRGALLEKKGNQPAEAMAAYQKGLEMVPDSPRLNSALASTLLREKQFEQAAAAETRRAETATSAAQRDSARLTRGNILWSRLQNPDDARTEFSVLRQESPQLFNAIQALSEIDSQQQKWASLADDLSRQSEMATDPSDRADYLIHLALLQRLKLSQPEAALENLRKASDAVPDDLAIIDMTIDLAESIGEWARAAEMLGRKMKLAADQEKMIEIMQEIGVILLTRLDRAKDAEGYLRKVIATKQNDVEVLRLLGTIYEQQKRYQELAQNINQRAALIGPGRESMLLYQWLGSICEEKLNLPDKAIEAYRRAFQLDPQNTATLQKLSDLLTSTGRWPELIEVLEQDAEQTMDPKQTVATYIRIGEIYEEKLKDSQKAIESFEKVLAFAPTYLPALRALARLYRAIENWDALVKIYKKEAKQSSDHQIIISLALKRAELSEEKLSNVAEATLAFGEVLHYAPDHPAAIASYERLLKAQQNTKQLEEFYRRQIEVIEDPSLKVDFYEKLGLFLIETPGREAEAADAFRPVLEARPDDAKAFASLTRLLQKLELHDEIQKLYDSAPPSLQGPQLTLKKARLLENAFNKPQEAAEAYAAVLEQDPENAVASAALERLSLVLGDFSRLIERLSARSQKIKSPKLLAWLHARQGDLARHFLDDNEAAEASYRKAVELDPQFETGHQLLIDFLEENGRWKELVDARRQYAGVTGDPKVKLDQWREIGTLFEMFGADPKNVLAAWEQALHIDQQNPQLLRHVAGLAEKAGDDGKAAAFYGRLIEQLQDPAEKLSAMLRLASLWENRLNDPERAIPIYRQALTANAENEAARRALVNIYYQTSRWDELVQLFVEETSRYQGKDQVLSFWLEIGRIRLIEQKNVAQAMQAYEKALEVDPKDLRALGAITDLYEHTQQWDKYLEAADRELQLTDDPQKKVRSLKKQAKVQEEKLGSRIEAIGRLTRAFEIDPKDSEALEELVRLTQAESAPNDSIRWLRELLNAYTEPAALAETHHRISKIASEQLEDMQLSETALLDARKADGTFIPAMFDLAELYFKTSRWDETVEVSEALLKLEEPPLNRAGHFVRIGQALQRGKGDPGGAKIHYEKALAEVPTFVPALSAIGSLYEDAGEWEKACDTYTKFAEILVRDDPKKTLPLRNKLGWIYKEKLDERPKAILEYNRAVALDEDNLEANTALSDLFTQEPSKYPRDFIRQNIKMVRLKPTEAIYYRRLSAHYDKIRAYDKVFCIYRVIDKIAPTNELEKTFLESNIPSAPSAPKAQIDAEMRENLLSHSMKRSPAGRMLIALDSALDKIYAPNIGAYGLHERKDKITKKMASSNRTRAQLDEWATALSLPDYLLYTSSNLDSVAFENTAEPSLVIGNRFMANLPPDEQKFILGRSLAVVTGGQILAEKLSVEEIEALIWASVYFIMDNANGPKNERIAALTAELKKIMPRKTRKELEDIVPEFYRSSAEFSARDLKDGFTKTADRLGLLFCGDPGAAVKAIAKLQPTAVNLNLSSPEGMGQFLQSNKNANSLWNYALSETYFNLRARLKLNIA